MKTLLAMALAAAMGFTGGTLYDTDDVMHKLDDIELNMLTTQHDLYQIELNMLKTHDLYQLDNIALNMLTTVDLLTYCN